MRPHNSESAEQEKRIAKLQQRRAELLAQAHALDGSIAVLTESVARLKELESKNGSGTNEDVTHSDLEGTSEKE